MIVLISCNQAQNSTPNTPQNDASKSTETAKESIPLFVQCLMEAYPDQIIGYADNLIYWSDSTTMVYDDGKEKSAVQKMDDADIEDMSYWVYPDEVTDFNDAGRIRNEAFFKKMYGKTQGEMNKNLTSVVWCPKLVGQTLRISKVNGVDKQLKKLSDELDQHPEWKKSLSGPSTVNWRVVAGTNRLIGNGIIPKPQRPMPSTTATASRLKWLPYSKNTDSSGVAAGTTTTTCTSSTVPNCCSTNNGKDNANLSTFVSQRGLHHRYLFGRPM